MALIVPRRIDTFGVLITVRRSEDGIDELVGRVSNIVTHTLDDDHRHGHVNNDGARSLTVIGPMVPLGPAVI